MPGTSKAALQSQGAAATRNLGGDNPLYTEKLISDNGLKQDDADAVRRQVQGVLNRVGNPGSVSKSDVLGMQKQLAGMASDAEAAANRSGAAEDVSKARVLRGLDVSLRKSLGFDTKVVSPQDAKALSDDILTNGSVVSPSGAAAVAKDITDAANSPEGLTVGQVRNMESNMVRLQQSAKDAITAKDKNFGASTSSLLPVAGAVAGMGGKKSALGTLAGMATGSAKADSLASSGLSDLAGVTSKNSKLVSKIIPIASRIAGVTGSNIPNDIQSTNSAIPVGSVPGQQGGTTMAPTNATAAQNPEAALYNEIIAQSQTPGGISGNLITTANALAPQIQKQVLAAPVINSALSAYGNAGGAQGTVGGLVSGLTGLVGGTPANTYSTDSAAAAAQLASVLGITPEQAAAMLPQLMQTSQSAAPQVNNLQSILGSISQPTSGSAIPAQ
jgi:hypothetical protein